MAEKIIGFDEANKIALTGRKHLVLGNGFSIALKPDIFSYGSLYENADFSKSPHLKKVFECLKTNDFEVVIRSLLTAADVLEIYSTEHGPLAKTLRKDAEAVKDALVNAIAKRHPDRPYDIPSERYAACRQFLANFSHIFTLNYDVLLYWTLMQDEVDKIDLRPDDGFRHPEADPDLPYVSWQQAQSATVHYLHGALHVFDRDTEITKYTWSKTDKAIVDQIREALAENKFPLFVAEGDSASKTTRILHNAYLHKALRSFEACCQPAKNVIVIFGHSLADNDDHVLKCISAGRAANLLVSIHGDPNSPANKTKISKAHLLKKKRYERYGDRAPLEVTFFDSDSAKIWG